MLAMLSFVYITFRLNTPPEALPEDAPATEFSAGRAWKHIEVIGSVKNPIGSNANREVRNYILQELQRLGLEPELHLATFYDSRRQQVADLANILARIPGQGSGRAILFMGHYDTVPDAYGASDNGSAVSVMLELIRMLQHHPPLEQDLIFFFPDGEEVGLLGARAFLKEHRWADDVAFVVNLEARGTAGQSFMFETGYNNLETISAFADLVPFPTANSVSYEVYERMPNDTDFSPFKERHFQGLNFAYIENLFDYHTAGDNPENTDIRSVQHHGSSAGAIALGLGNRELQLQAEGNAIYFNTIGYGFTYYPYTWAVPLSIGVVLLLVILLYAGSAKNILHPRGWMKGIAAFIIHMVFLYIIIHSLWSFISGFYPGSERLLPEYNQGRITPGFASIAVAFSLAYVNRIVRGICFTHALLLLLFVLLLLVISGEMTLLKGGGALAASALLFVLFRKPLSPYDLGAGALVVFAVLMTYTAVFVPGASYLLTWPLAGTAIGYLIIFAFAKNPERKIWPAVVLFFAAVPVIALFSPLIRFFWIAMGLPASAAAVLLIGLMAGFLIPHMEMVTRIRPLLFPVIFLAAGIGSLVAGSAWLTYDERHRKPVNISYVYNAETGTGRWVSSDRTTNEWSEKFLTGTPDTLYLVDFSPVHGQRYLAGPAMEETSLHAPSARLLHDTIIGGRRVTDLHVQADKATALLHLYLHSKGRELQIQFDGQPGRTLQPHQESNWYRLRYLAPPEKGFRVSVYTDPHESLKLKLTGVSFELPDHPGIQDMPAHMMPRGHSTLATRRYSFQ